LGRIGSLEAHIATMLRPQRFSLGLIDGFGLLGLLIATSGVFAVTAFGVS
jgi:hypothetical protein